MVEFEGSLPTSTNGRLSTWGYLGRVWRYRHLCFHLAGADLQSRFRRSSLGIFWAMIHPLAFAMLYSFMLSSLFHQDFRAFSIYVFSGVVLWDAIAAFINAGASSIINASGYAKQSSIPLIIFPIRTCLTICFILMLSFISFAAYTLAISVLFGHKVYFGILWFWVVPAFAAMFLVGIPVATLTGLLNVQFRDTQQFLIVGTQALWFSSPIFIAREIFDSPQLKYWEAINPVVAICDVFRDPIVRGVPPSLSDWAVIGVWAGVLWLLSSVFLATVGRKAIFHL